MIKQKSFLRCISHSDEIEIRLHLRHCKLQSNLIAKILLQNNICFVWFWKIMFDWEFHLFLLCCNPSLRGFSTNIKLKAHKPEFHRILLPNLHLFLFRPLKIHSQTHYEVINKKCASLKQPLQFTFRSINVLETFRNAAAQWIVAILCNFKSNK